MPVAQHEIRDGFFDDETLIKWISESTTECFCCFNRLSFMHVWSNFCACHARLRRAHNSMADGEIRESLLHWMLNLVEFFHAALPSKRETALLQQVAEQVAMLPRMLFLMPHCTKSVMQRQCLAGEEDHGVICDFRMELLIYSSPLLCATSVAGTSLDIIYFMLQGNRAIQGRIAQDQKGSLRMARRILRCARCIHYPITYHDLTVGLECIVECVHCPALLECFREAEALGLIIYALSLRIAPIVELACQALMAMFVGDRLFIEGTYKVGEESLVQKSPSQMAAVEVDQSVRLETIEMEIVDILIECLEVDPSDIRFFQPAAAGRLRRCGFLQMQSAVASVLHTLCFAGLSDAWAGTSSTVKLMNAALSAADVMMLIDWPLASLDAAASTSAYETRKRELAETLDDIDMAPRLCPLLMLVNTLNFRTCSGTQLQDLCIMERIRVPEWRCIMRMRRYWKCGIRLQGYERTVMPHMRTVLDRLWARWGPCPAKGKMKQDDTCWKESILGQRYDWTSVVRRRSRSASCGKTNTHGQDSDWVTSLKVAHSERALFGDTNDDVVQEANCLADVTRHLTVVKTFSEVQLKRKAVRAVRKAPSTASRPTFDMARAVLGNRAKK